MNISIIGAGNMGGAIACGLIRAGAIRPAELCVADVHDTALQPLRQQGIRTFAHGAEAVAEADIVIVAVKPWIAKEVLHKIRPALPPKAMLVSIAAGITLAQLQGELGGNTASFRVIPNTAIAVGQSMTFIASDSATHEQEQSVLALFAAVGQAMLIPEALMAAATALSSCGIAYAMRYLSANMR
ncbi:MAG: NAD(P)-binding domain-containing protein, partial [Prevotellaceae bacterium]|nr:NAD(P)-binding domain-containing protein [Prevotellaceae bacterium]